MALHLVGLGLSGQRDRTRLRLRNPPLPLDRPRIDVTLRVSGLFRDVFPSPSGLYQQAVEALAQRLETPDRNLYGVTRNSPHIWSSSWLIWFGYGMALEQFSDAAANCWML